MRIEAMNNNVFFSNDKALDKTESISFGKYLEKALDSVNEAQVKADEESIKVMTGVSDDLEGALIAAEEARIQMELTVQIRNKLLESYQEISRMQI
jgi:flagellar hook-basal body complex protein FliE